MCESGGTRSSSRRSLQTGKGRLVCSTSTLGEGLCRVAPGHDGARAAGEPTLIPSCYYQTTRPALAAEVGVRRRTPILRGCTRRERPCQVLTAASGVRPTARSCGFAISNGRKGKCCRDLQRFLVIPLEAPRGWPFGFLYLMVVKCM